MVSKPIPEVFPVSWRRMPAVTVECLVHHVELFVLNLADADNVKYCSRRRRVNPIGCGGALEIIIIASEYLPIRQPGPSKVSPIIVQHASVFPNQNVNPIERITELNDRRIAVQKIKVVAQC